MVKVYYEDDEKIEEESFEGVTPAELAVLADDDAIEIAEQETIEIGIDEISGEPIVVYNVEIKRTVPDGTIRIINIPPEEFLFSRRATDLETANFVAHRTSMTVSDDGLRQRRSVALRRLQRT